MFVSASAIGSTAVCIFRILKRTDVNFQHLTIFVLLLFSYIAECVLTVTSTAVNIIEEGVIVFITFLYRVSNSSVQISTSHVNHRLIMMVSGT